MKCSKCGYLGFETGSRCKNCGFDFSLQSPAIETPDAPAEAPSSDAGWLRELDESLGRSRGTDGRDTPVDVQALLDRVLAPGEGERRAPGGPASPAPEPEAPPIESRPASGAAPVDRPAPSMPARAERHGGAATARAEPHREEEPAASPAVDTDTRPEPGSRPAPASEESSTGRDVVGDLSMRTPESPLRASDGRAGRSAPVLPLFGAEDGEPPARLRSGPRPPLAVRRTPDAARVRAIAREVVADAREDEPALRFAETPEPERATALHAGPRSAGAPRRLAAALIDGAVLAGLAAAVMALTLRMLELPVASWRLVPVAPMASFLLVLAFAYLSAFTAAGGQTIGKMAAGVRVVGGDGASPGAAVAVRRTLASAISVATLGLGFLPALVGSARLAVHDRIAGTRVVDIPRE